MGCHHCGVKLHGCFPPPLPFALSHKGTPCAGRKDRGRRAQAEIGAAGSENRDADGASGAEEKEARGRGGCAHTESAVRMLLEGLRKTVGQGAACKRLYAPSSDFLHYVEATGGPEEPK